MPLKNIGTTSRWIWLLRWKWLRWIWTGELFIGQWTYDTRGHQGRDTLEMTTGWSLAWTLLHTLSVNMEWCCNQASQMVKVSLVWGAMVEILVCGGMLGFTTLLQTCQGKHVFTVVEATTIWLEAYPMSLPRMLSWGLEKQALWEHGTTETTESDTWTHFWNNLIDSWSKEHGIEWLHHNSYQASASRKIEL